MKHPRFQQCLRACAGVEDSTRQSSDGSMPQRERLRVLARKCQPVQSQKVKGRVCKLNPLCELLQMILQMVP